MLQKLITVLMDHGHHVLAFDVWSPSLERFRSNGGRTATSVSDCAAQSNVLVLMVVNADQAVDVLVGKGALEGEL